MTNPASYWLSSQQSITNVHPQFIKIQKLNYKIFVKNSNKLLIIFSNFSLNFQTEKTTMQTVSKLMLSAVTPKDSGRYTCRPSSGSTSGITVHVKSGNKYIYVFYFIILAYK